MNMMGKVKELQEKMEKIQEDIVKIEEEGVSGGGLVHVRLNGKNELLGLKIDSSLCKKEEIEILEDLIIAAHKDAKKKIEARMLEKTRGVTDGLSLPPGFKLPL